MSADRASLSPPSAHSTISLPRSPAQDHSLQVSTFSKLQPFIASLAIPRQVMLLVPAGQPVESAINTLTSYLGAGDVIIDFGNECLEKIVERQKRLEPSGVVYATAQHVAPEMWAALRQLPPSGQLRED
jgi:6-phosphogluconate dehydrogenase